MKLIAKRHLGIGCLFFIFLTSCVKEIALKSSDQKKLLVINSIFSTSESIKIRLSQTLSNTISSAGLVPGAEIKLFENNVCIDTLNDLGNGNYTSKIIPLPQRNYLLTATHNNFPAVRTTEILPTPVKLNSFTFKYIGSVYSDHNDDYIDAIETSLSFDDPPGEKNYYELIFTAKSSSPIDPGSFVNPLFFDNPVIANEGDASYKPSTYFFSDELFDGTNFTIKLKLSFLGGTSNGVLKPRDYFVSFRSVSYNYYKYRKLWTRHKYNQSSKISFWEDIFKGEPIDMFTNVENGYGIFAGYVSDEMKGTYIPQ